MIIASYCIIVVALNKGAEAELCGAVKLGAFGVDSMTKL